MATKTITLIGAEVAVTGLDGAHAHIRNDGTEVIYASKTAGITAGADGVASIPAGQSDTIRGISGKVYLLGTGSVLIQSDDYVASPFKTSAQAGGSGADEVARAAINAHSGNAEIHVTADEKASWTKWMHRDMNILTNAAWEMPYESYINDADAVDLGIVPQNNGSYWHIHYFRALPGMGFGLQIAMPLNLAAGMPVYRKSEGTTWGSWYKFADDGNAATLDTHPASDFVLKTDYDALAARVAALEGGTT